MTDKKTLVLIDGHALAFRSYFALERTGMKTSDKQPTWAVFGFFKAIFDLLKNKNLKLDAIGVAFDVSHDTFRVKEYSEYKANREAMPDTLKSQMQLIFEGLRAFNIPIYTKEGFEADDVIGTIATKACDLGHNTTILTGDQDAFQLIRQNSCITVLIPSKGELVCYDWQRVHDKLGVYPDQIIDYKALRGDTSDNIPGIRGIGEKTAAKLLTDWGTLENIYANLDKIEGKSLKIKLEEGEEIAKLSQFLATIKLDVEVDFDFEKTNIEMPDVEKVAEFFKKLQLYSFLKNINDVLKPFGENGSTISAIKKTKSVPTIMDDEEPAQKQLGFSFLMPQSEPEKQLKISNTRTTVKNIEELQLLIKALNNKTLISFEAEPSSQEDFDATLTGIAVAYNDNLNADGEKIVFSNEIKETKSFYIPLDHDGATLPVDDVLSLLRPVFENEKITKTIYDIKNEINLLKKYDITLKGSLFDTMLASYVNDPSRKHDLKSQSLQHLEIIIKEWIDVVGKGKSKVLFNTIDTETASKYACNNVFANLELTKFWTQKLKTEDMKLLKEIEIPSAVVLAEMEFNGVSLDVQYLEDLSDELNGKLEKIEDKIFAIAGETFNVNSPRQVGQILFEKLGLKPHGKKRGAQNFSTDAKVLTELAQDFNIAKYLLEQRQCSKLKTTYVDALPFLVSKSDRKIHTHYNQTITVTGRLSSSNPNLQNIPIKTELGNRIRKAFVPSDRENQLLLSADYSQIELRLLAHVSGDKTLIEAFRADIDVHAQTASKIFDVPVQDVTKSMRSKAKAVNFGIVYGQTRYGLASAINITPQEAQLFIDKYFQHYPGVQKYMEKAVSDAYQNGYAQTIYGRKRYLLDELMSSNHQIKEFAQRAAINSPLQGAAADIIKMAMIELYKKLKNGNYRSKLIMQVHDELILEVYKDELEEVKKLVVEAMELGQPFKVPLEVDVEIGTNWMDGE